MTIQTLDVVVLTRDLPEHGLRRGISERLSSSTGQTRSA